MHSIEAQIMQANPILEAFGNAKTVRNNNSSRFGKFIRIEFDRNGQISGANIDHYLLEKSRVIHHDAKERSFHIFYQLLDGANEEMTKKYLLERKHSYKYLDGDVYDVEGSRSNADEFQSTLDAMKVLGFEDSELDAIWSILSGILQFGNLSFYNLYSDDSALFKETDTVNKLCQVLGLNSEEFQEAMLKPTIKAGNFAVTATVTAEKAEFYAQALAKSMYDRLFRWLVSRVNSTLESKSSQANFIGVLDIAGFEIFKVNFLTFFLAFYSSCFRSIALSSCASI
jgi:myosin protein heavy chain